MTETYGARRYTSRDQTFLTLKDPVTNVEYRVAYEWKPQSKRLVLDYTAMYSAPAMSYAFLRGLVEHFGTELIDTSEVSHQGCETCDHGSEYGFTIYIDNPTRNLP